MLIKLPVITGVATSREAAFTQALKLIITSYTKYLQLKQRPVKNIVMFHNIANVQQITTVIQSSAKHCI